MSLLPSASTTRPHVALCEGLVPGLQKLSRCRARVAYAQAFSPRWRASQEAASSSRATVGAGDLARASASPSASAAAAAGLPCAAATAAALQRARSRRRCQPQRRGAAVFDTQPLLEEEEEQRRPRPAGQRGRDGAADAASGEAVLGTVLFDAPRYYVQEDIDQVKIDVLRIGGHDRPCSVRYYTENGSAVVGMRFEGVEGELVFEPGETSKSFVVPVLHDNTFNTTMEFTVRLTDPKGCEVGRELHMAQVHIIDKDYFPSNRFAAAFQNSAQKEENRQKVEGVLLLFEYVKLNFSFPSIRDKTLKLFGIDLLQNLYFLLTTYLIKYVADDVLGGASLDPRKLLVPYDFEQTLVLVGVLYIFPYFLLNLLDVWKSRNLRVAEDSKCYLQENLFQRYTSYSEQARASVPPSEMSLIMVFGVSKVVDSGYMTLFGLSNNFGKLLVSAYFIQTQNPEADTPLIVFALAITIYIAVSFKEKETLTREMARSQASIVDIVYEGNFRADVIADYHLETEFQETLTQRAQTLSRNMVPVELSNTSSNYFMGWLDACFIAAYMTLGGMQVLEGDLQIGAFLATINVLKEIGTSYTQIFGAVMELAKAIGPLQRITDLMNLESSEDTLMAIIEQRREYTREERLFARLRELHGVAGDFCGADRFPISFRHVDYVISDSSGHRKLLDDVSISVPQGKVVAVVGARHQGRSSVMRLIGMAQTPTTGSILVPSYCRILHVEAPSLLNGSLWRNIAVGRKCWQDLEFETQRVISICKRLRLGMRHVRSLEETREEVVAGIHDFTDSEWQRTLGTTDKVLIHLARALIYNPEVLVLHTPANNLDADYAEQVFTILREFVTERGIGFPAHERPKRSPRTLFVSCSRKSGLTFADTIWKVEAQKITEMSIDEAKSFELLV